MVSRGSFCRARMAVSLPGIEEDAAQALIDAAHLNCPYSKATRGNLSVTLTLV
jgi:osmotically inducible protein OsmC